MHNIDPESSVPELLIDSPQLLDVFQALGIEYTCGGKSLQTACREQGLDLVAVLQRCEEHLRTSAG